MLNPTCMYFLVFQNKEFWIGDLNLFIRMPTKGWNATFIRNKTGTGFVEIPKF